MIRVGIVGAGFTGVAFAVHLARAVTRPLEIVFVEPRDALGAGLAYGSAADEHRINVPSDRMDVFREDPLHFTRWLHSQGLFERDAGALTDWGHHYSSRRDFGRYMASLLDEARQVAVVTHVQARAVALGGSIGRRRIRTDDGREFTVDALGLFVSHAPPGFPWPCEGLDPAHDESVLPDPWCVERIRSIPAGADIVIAGTGLTMADVIVSLRGQGHRGSIKAFSRRGLLPRAQIERFDLFPFVNGGRNPATARELSALTRRRVREAEACGLAWQAALDGLRKDLPSVWSFLTVAERRRAAARLRPFWDVHRFRMAPQVAALLEAGLREGWLAIEKGRVGALRRGDGRLLVSVRHTGETRLETCDVFINCTGPDGRLADTRNPMLRALLESGDATLDAIGAGLAVDKTGRAVSAAGQAQDDIRVAGPLTRGTVAEVVGVPEASESARTAAEDLAGWLERSSKPVSSPRSGSEVTAQ